MVRIAQCVIGIASNPSVPDAPSTHINSHFFHRFNCFCPNSPSHYFIKTNDNIYIVPSGCHTYSVVPPPPATLFSTAALIGAAAGLAAIVVAFGLWYFKYRKVCFRAFALSLQNSLAKPASKSICICIHIVPLCVAQVDSLSSSSLPTSEHELLGDVSSDLNYAPLTTSQDLEASRLPAASSSSATAVGKVVIPVRSLRSKSKS